MLCLKLQYHFFLTLQVPPLHCDCPESVVQMQACDKGYCLACHSTYKFSVLFRSLHCYP